MFYLTLSGKIPTLKQSEFEGTASLVSTQIPLGCISHGFFRDKSDLDTYRFFTYWNSIEDLERFKKSSAYIILTTAFSHLGKIIETQQGRRDEVPIFHA
ncbi:antibiotic biosynthesis monooxygenase family protein [Pollutibacter soli]|uniref:antibiotic biosynthesis monooxygenase family protein n=1 Tax=Pollutibacter soli TaxID=3034157 RepID=UPI003013B079